MNLISGKHKAIGLIGHPVEHTLSPLIHSVFAESTDLRVVYIPFNVRPENVREALYGMSAMGFLGTNVTIPHKEEVVKYLDFIDPYAERLGSVNTIVFKESRLSGYSTDGEGFLMALAHAGIDVKGMKIAMFGAGGAARAVLPALLSKGAAEVGIIARNLDKASALCRSFGEKVIMYEDSDIKNADLVINATPLGMSTYKNDTPLKDLSLLNGKAAVVDMVYNPRKTILMKDAQALGCKASGGIGMLVYQAALAFRHFTGIMPPKDTVQKLLYTLEMEKSIVLTGFMGSGKSTVGRLLAAQLSTEFIDTDTIIENEAGMTIPEIFERHGEAYFRELERKTVREFARRGGAVISVGGGAVLDKGNMDELMENSLVFWLKPSPKKVLENLREKGNRPLIRTKTDEEILNLMAEREKFYKCCHEKIEIGNENASETVNKVIEKYFKINN